MLVGLLGSSPGIREHCHAGVSMQKLAPGCRKLAEVIRKGDAKRAK